tara:strand:+ start:29875 stop:30678 length:804 start_codon:yes stop_codon:yes gene_type:complete
MQSIINSIVKNRNLIIYVFLSFITINFLYKKSNIHYNQFSKIATSFSGKTSVLAASLNYYFNLRNENKKLIEENLNLKKNQLKDITLNQKTINPQELSNSILIGKVIVNSVNKNNNIIVIDKGRSNGINEEMGVISSDGVVGIIKSVSNNYSSIISLLNTELRINALLKNTSTIGSLSWNGASPKILKLNDIPLSSTIKIGDTIVTGGMSFYFPKGIPIGKIVNYDNSSLEGYYEIDILTFNDFTSLTNLYILPRTDNPELKSLIDE